MNKLFYRICNPESQQGLWYTPTGEHTGLIHTDFSFCINSKLEMPYDPLLTGWLSATPTLEEFWHWFPQQDVLKLQEHGYYIHLYAAEQYMFYAPMQHWVISQATSILVSRLELSSTISINSIFL